MKRPQRGIMLNTCGSGRTLRLTRPLPGIFCKSYQCHSMACLDREGLEFGDKIIMPQAAFQEAHRLRLKLPLLFKVVNADANTRRIIGTAGPAPYQFCGVLEFSAPDDQVYLPFWMMQSLLLAEGARVELRSILRPPAGSFVRFKPHDDTFLDLAARQGPKALMEGALRRYSVLSEGATILVQHEGENFYLDVVEARTFAASSSSVSNVDNGASSSSPREPTHAERDGTYGGNGESENRDGTANVDDDRHSSPLVGGVSEGKRVRLVCLLGDLDLEVEFCAPHAPLPGQGVAEHSLEHSSEHRAEGHRDDPLAQPVGDEDRNHNWRESRGSMNETSPSPNASQLTSCVMAGPQRFRPSSAFGGAAGPNRSQPEQKGQRRLAWSLPAPARARKSCDGDDLASRLRPETPQRRTGQLGIKPPAPPSLMAKYRAFSGEGMSLLGEMTDCPSTGETVNKVAGTERTNCDLKPSSPRSVTPASSTTLSGVPKGNVGPADTGVGASWPGGRGRAIQRSKSSGERGLLEGVDGAAVGNGRCSVTETRGASSAGGRLLGKGTPTSVMPTTQERGRSCGATGTDAAAVAETQMGAGATTACGRCENLVPTANLRLHELRCSSSSSSSSKAVPQQQHPSPLSTTGPCTKPAQIISDEPSARHTEPDVTPVPTKTTAAPPSSEFPCAYCGLIFRAAGPAGEHEEICGTRTERCDRCCSHVPRRDAASHRQPGGGCDAVIAAAEAHEKNVLTAGRSLALYGSSSGSASCGGGGEGGDRSGAMGGRFDALLAEAVRSSKAASTALADARAENDARMLEAVEPTPLAGRKELLHLRPDSCRGGGGSGETLFAGKPGEAVAGAAEDAAKDRSDALATAVNALETGCAGTPIGAGGNHGSQRCEWESGTNRNPHAFGAIGTSNNASLLVHSRLTADPSARLTTPTVRSHIDILGFKNGGETNPSELSSPRRSRSREGAGRPDCLSWACRRCTLINPGGSKSCEACGFVPRLTEHVLQGTASGRRQPCSNPLENFTEDSVPEAVVQGTSAAAIPGLVAGDILEASGRSTTAETDAVAQAAQEATAPMDGSPHRRQATSRPVPLRATTAAFPPDLDSPPPPGRTSLSKERRLHAVRQAPLLAAVLPSSPPTVRSSKNTRASRSAPQPRRAETPSGLGSSGAHGRDDAGRAFLVRTRHTAPATTSSAFSVTGMSSGLIGVTEARAAGPRARCLRSSLTFVSADTHHSMQPRGRKDSSAPQGLRAVRHRHHHQQHEHALQVSRGRGTPHTPVGRRRLMGPPRRLGGIHRPSRRLRNAPPPSVAPPTDTTTSAAESSVFTPGFRAAREVGVGQDLRHSRKQLRESLESLSPPTSASRPTLQGGGLGGSVGGRGAVSATRPPPSSAAPACDISLSILGRSQARGGNSGRVQVPGGGQVSRGGAAETGKCSRRPEYEGELVVSLTQEISGGIGALGRRCGVGKGEGRAAAAAAAAAVGVAPLKLRRRVSDTRTLETLVAR